MTKSANRCFPCADFTNFVQKETSENLNFFKKIGMKKVEERRTIIKLSTI